MRAQKIFSRIPLLCLASSTLLFLGAQNPPTPPGVAISPVLPAAPQAPITPARPHPLVWDAMEKTYTPEFGELNAPFSFWVTNTSDIHVSISNVSPSCGCTVADYPKPWNLAPGESGEVKANMSLAGKSGTQVKIMTVFSAGGSQVLTMKVPIPEDTNEERRKRNMAAAAKDRQAVFKADCAACHVEPLKGLKGEQLFVAGCNICHEPPTGSKRADIVPNLHTLAFPTDKAYWKKIIADGKEGSLMPGFAKAHGGPLTEEEIDSLAEYAVKTFKFDPANVKKTN